MKEVGKKEKALQLFDLIKDKIGFDKKYCIETCILLHNGKYFYNCKMDDYENYLKISPNGVERCQQCIDIFGE